MLCQFSLERTMLKRQTLGLVKRITTIMLAALCWACSNALAVTVTNTNDSGIGSLRNAITTANTATGSTVTFAIPTTDANYDSTTGAFTIRPATALPSLTSSGSSIDGTTQTSSIGDTNPHGPEIIINGQLTTSSNGLRLSGGNNVLRGVIVNGFSSGYGIVMASANGRVEGCYSGTDSTGNSAVPNYTGLIIESVSGVTIGGNSAGTGNRICFNTSRGIEVYNRMENTTESDLNRFGSFRRVPALTE